MNTVQTLNNTSAHNARTTNLRQEFDQYRPSYEKVIWSLLVLTYSGATRLDITKVHFLIIF